MSSGKLTAAVRATRDGAGLFIKEQRVAPLIFYVSIWHDAALQAGAKEQVRLAHQAGVPIISTAIWDAYWFPPDVPVDYSRRDVDVWLKVVWDAWPDALIIPRFNVDYPPQWWFDAHPDEAMRDARGERIGPASLQSEVWRRDVVEHVQRMVNHLERRYGDRIAGYHPCGQTTAEWFYEGMWDGRLGGFEPPVRSAWRRWLQEAYQTEQSLQRAWNDRTVRFDTVTTPGEAERLKWASGDFADPRVDQRLVDFARFLNDTNASAVDHVSRAIRQVAPDKLVVVFYGYIHELSGAPNGLASSGHCGLGRILRSPAIDIIASPVSYADRGPGGGGYHMGPVDSAALHGKLWLFEDDTRTHLSSADSAPGRCADHRETLGVLRRNFGATITRGASLWWMDLPGQGWFRDEPLWADLKPLVDAYTRLLPTQGKHHPDLAVLVDEQGVLDAHPSPRITAPLLGAFRVHWMRTGCSTGVYLFQDALEGRVPPARMYLVLGAYRLDRSQRDQLKRMLQRRGSTIVWMGPVGLNADGVQSVQHVTRVAGMRLRERTGATGLRLVGGQSFDPGHAPLSRQLCVDGAAEPLAWYADDGTVAVARRRFAGWTSVYSGVLQLPTSLLRQLARDAGAHIIADSDDVVMAGNGVVSLHACSSGEKRLRWTRAVRWSDLATGETLYYGRELRRELQQGDTLLMRLS